MVLDANGVVVERLVRQVGQRDIIRGTLTGQAKLSASGNSEADMVGTMKGEVRGQVRDGAIVGYNVRKMIWPSASRQYNPRNTTPFSSLKADFIIADGVASSPSILLDGPSHSHPRLMERQICARPTSTTAPISPSFHRRQRYRSR